MIRRKRGRDYSGYAQPGCGQDARVPRARGRAQEKTQYSRSRNSFAGRMPAFPGAYSRSRQPVSGHRRLVWRKDMHLRKLNGLTSSPACSLIYVGLGSVQRVIRFRTNGGPHSLSRLSHGFSSRRVGDAVRLGRVPRAGGARPEGDGGVLDSTSRSPTKRNAALADGSGAVADNS